MKKESLPHLKQEEVSSLVVVAIVGWLLPWGASSLGDIAMSSCQMEVVGCMVVTVGGRGTAATSS